MADIYKIAVNLAMQSNAPAFLAALTKQLHIAHVHVKDLEGGLNRLSRVKLAVGGGLSIAAGAGILGFLKQGIESTKELSHELTQLQKLNIGPIRLAQVRSAAIATTQQVSGVNEVDALKMYGSAYSIFGHEGALKLIKPLSEFAQVAGNTSGNYEKAADSIYAMVRAGDLMGKFIDERTHQVDVGKLQHFLDLGSKVILGTHGKVDSNAWLQLAQQGGPALSGMSDQGLLTMAIAAQAMGGPRAGTALTSLYQQMIGGKMTKPVAEKLHELGLLGGFDVGKGGHLTFHKGALNTDFTRALKEDPINAVKIMKEHLEKHGYDTIEKQVPMLFEILGRQTTQRLVHDLLRNLPQILAERERISGSQGVGEAKSTQDTQDIVQAEHNLEEGWKNLKFAFFGPDSAAYIGILNQLTGAINGLTGSIRGMKPETLVSIAKGFGILGVALAGGGAVALIAALGPAGWFAAGLVLVGVALAKFKPEALAQIGAGFTKIWDALTADKLDAKKLFDGVADVLKGGFALIVKDILTWPARLADAIVAMGAGVVSAIAEQLKGIGKSVGDGLKKYFSDPSVGGFMPGAYHGDGAGNGGGFIRASYGGSAANDNAYRGFNGRPLGVGGPVGGGLADSIMNGAGGAGFNTRGVRNMNPGNIGYGAWARAHGSTGAAGTDTGHGVAVFPSFEAGYAAMGALALSKYAGGARSIDALIAGAHGWTPGNHAAAANVARMMGISPFADAHLNDPAMMAKFKAGLSVQELGPAGARYARGHMHVPPPPKQPQEHTIHVPVHLDGKIMARAMTKYRVADGKHPTSVGGPDTHGHFQNPGTPLTDAA